MKSFASQIIALTIFLTGYCPSILNGTHQMTMSPGYSHELKIKSPHQQMSCCENEMPEATDAILNNSINAEVGQAIIFQTRAETSQPIKISPNWKLTGHNSSPPHLSLTGSSIMRE